MAAPAAFESIEIRGVDQASARFRRMLTVLGSKLMSDIGLFLMTRIKTRTLAGKDAEGAFFKPYSARYAFFRRNKGRPVDKVDLFFTGSMQGSMTFSASSDSVRVFFMGTQDSSGTSNPAKAFWLNKKRRFFAMSDQDRKDVAGLVLDAFERGSS